VAVLVAVVATALGCKARPLTDTDAGGGGTVDTGGGGNADGGGGGNADAGGGETIDTGPAPCQPGDLLIGFSLCGTVDGRPVSYVPQYLESYERGNSAVTFEGLGPDGGWLAAWGANEAWHDSAPRDVSGWLFKPPPGWFSAGTWACGQAGTITRHADDSLDATLTEPAILPACSGEGGPDSFHADLTGGILRYDQAGGCEIGFTNTDFKQMEILTDICPPIGVRLPLDGMRVVTRQRGATPSATVCIGPGASVTLLPDSTASNSHLLVDIPSMSAPETCGPATSGELIMKVKPNPRG